MSLENSNTDDLLQRCEQIIGKYVELTLELSAKLEKFGKYRNELQLLTVELTKRGVIVDSNKYENKIADELNRIETLNDQNTTNNT
jgi:hypothetical protein